MSPDDSFPDLMARLRSGEDTAAREIFERFTWRLLALARRQFAPRLRPKVDPEDVVQSAYKSFFIRCSEGKLVPQNWDNLWGLLTLITLRKCADRARYFGAERRDAAREVSASTSSSPDSDLWRQAIDREPTPDEAALLAETVDQLLLTLDDDERHIVELSLQGHSTQEISQQLGRAERSVRRLRERVRKQLERMQNEGSS
jgi:RNA polymerase sigma-70 factor (ECF subfamily)